MKTILAICSLLLSTALLGEIKLSPLFSDGMMLQAGEDVAVWGVAQAGTELSVEFNGKTKTTTADANGEWSLKIGPFANGDKGELIIRCGEEKKQIADVLVGEIWLASGQSNMAWTVASSANAAEEMKNAEYPEIRFFKLLNKVAKAPLDELAEGQWVKISPKSVPGLSAVAYFFARELHSSRKIPVGIIESAWGGTPIESWMPKAALEKKDLYAPILERAKAIPADMDEFQKIEASIREEEKRDEYIKDEGISAEAAKFAEPGLDDASWQKMKLPQIWEKAPVNLKVDGAFWFRKTFNLDLREKIKEAKISLGPIDDFDISHLNGVELGRTTSTTENHWTVPRVYNVPVELLRNGDNIVAVRVFDHFGGGGFAGNAEQMKLHVTAHDGKTSEIPLHGEWRYFIEKQVKEPRKPVHPCQRASSLYNAMIFPVAPYGIRGFLWYQGESNAGRAYQYRELLPDMIACWRELWGGGEKPFLNVQLANFMERKDKYEPSAWAELREAQSLTLKNVPNTGMAVIIDIGDAKDIHPKNKQDVGRRLALWAKKLVHGEDIVFSGPLLRNAEFKDGKAVISFDHAADGLKSSSGDNKLAGFVIAGEDKVFHSAEATIEADKVVASSPEVPNPVSARYAWANNPPASLFNSAGLPASPFRTDDWKESTADNR